MKRYWIALLFLTGVIHASATTVIGSDDFNDNSRDTSKWSVLEGSELLEQNSRLEFVTAADSSFAAWRWNGGGGSYTQNWTVTYDTVNTSDHYSMNNSRNWVGLFSFFGSGDNSFGIEHTKGHDGLSYNLIRWNIKSGGIELEDNQLSVEGDSFSLRASFEAKTKKIHLSYDGGSGFIHLTSQDISGWGMTTGDSFPLHVYGENDGESVPSGQIYGDNFELTESDYVLSNEVHELKMEYSRDFGSADDPNDFFYWYDIEAETSEHVTSMRVQTPGGLDITETNAWDSGSELEWEVGDSSQSTPFDSLLDGEILITFGFSDGSYQTTTLPFTQNDGVTPIPPMSVEPTFSSPSPLAGSVQSAGTVNLQWPTPQAGVNFNEVGNKFGDDDEDEGVIGFYISGALDNLGWFPTPDGPVSTTSASVTLEQGFNSFAQYQGFIRTDYNADGIPYFINKLAEVTHEFFVSSPTALYDDFSGGTLDMAKWSVAGHDAGASLTVTGGQLEYANPAGVDNWEALSWEANSLSTTQDWSVMVQAGFQSEIQKVQLGLSVFGGNQELFLGYRYNDYGSYRVRTTGINLDTDTDTVHGENYYYGLDETLLRIDYDATSKILTTSVLSFGRFQQQASVSTSGWGMSATDTFVPTISVDNYSVPITAGQAYFDNFMIWWGDGSTNPNDADGDGLPDAWEIQFFGSTNAVPGGHGDSDAQNNGDEYIAGTDPTNSNSRFEVSNGWNNPAGFVVNWTAIEGRAYTVEWTDSLTNSFQTLETDITYPQNSYTDTSHNAESGGFYNLKVELDD